MVMAVAFSNECVFVVVFAFVLIVLCLLVLFSPSVSRVRVPVAIKDLLFGLYYVRRS
jgi:hypothetical protein